MKGIRILSMVLCVLMMLSIFLIFQEESEAATIDYIYLTDAPNGTVIPNMNLGVGEMLTIYASAYNSSTGYIGLLEVWWNETMGLGSFDNLTGTSTTFTAGSSGGVTTISGTNFTLSVTDDFELTILPSTVDYVLITDSPGGTPVLDKTVPTNFQESGNCSAYNNTMGYIGLVSADWTAEGGDSSLLSPTPGIGNKIDVGTIEGLVWFNVSYFGFTDSVEYTVISPTIDHIEITDVPDGTPLSGGVVFMGHKEWGNCSAYNDTHGYIGLVSADWTAVGGSSSLLGSTPAVSNGIDVGSIAATVWFNVSYGGHNDSVEYWVGNWTIDNIDITDTPGGTPLTGGTVPQNYQEYGNCSAYNDSVGFLFTVNANWEANGGNSVLLGSTPAHGNGIDVGTIEWFVWFNASYDTHYDGVMYTVTAPTVDYIEITESPAGTPLPDRTVPQNYQEWGNCSAYNFTSGYIGTVNADWIAAGGNSNLLGSTPAHGNGINVGTTPGIVWLNATYSGHYDSVEYNVSMYTINYIEITYTPGGTPLPGGSVSQGFQEWGNCSAYNATVGFICTVNADWAAQGGTSTLIGPSKGHVSGIDVGSTPVTVWFNTSWGVFTDSVNYSVGGVSIDYIYITDTPGGTPLTGGSVPDNHEEWGYCSAYNNTVGYIGTVNADWTAQGGTAWLLGSTPDTYNGINVSYTPGTVWFNASYGGHFDNVEYEVLVTGNVDYIVITYTPGGSSLTGGVVAVGYQEWGYASAYNNTAGYLGLVSANWVADGGNAYLLGSTPATTNGINVGTIASNVWFNASYMGHTDSVLYNVLAPTIDYIEITDSPNGVPLSGGWVPDGYQEWGYSSGYNSTAGYVGLVTADWTAEGGSAYLLGSTPDTTNGINVSNTPGYVWFNASSSGMSDSVQYIVGTYGIDYIDITDLPGGNPLTGGTVIAGYEEWGNCSAYNNTVGYLYTVNANWSAEGGNSTLIGPTEGAGSGINVGTIDDSYVWFNASYFGLTDSVQYFVENNWTIDYIIITDTPGGTPLPGGTVSQGYQEWGYCSVYNLTVGYIGLRSANWLADGGNSSLLGSNPATTNGIDVGTIGGWVWLRANYFGHTDSVQYYVSVTWTVDYIQIRDAPGGAGKSLSDPANYPTYPLGGSDTFYGAMYNKTYGYIGDVPSNSTWLSNNTFIVTVTTPGTSTFIQCDNSTEGSALITLNHFGGHVNTTIVTVTSGPIAPVDYIIIRDGSGGGGNVVGNANYLKGSTDTFWAAGYNNSVGFVGDVSVDWNSTDFGVGTVTSPGKSTTFTAVGGGNCTVSADYGGGITDTTGLLTVWTVDFIHIRDAPNSGGSIVGDKTYNLGQNDTFWAAGYNNTFGYLGDLYVTWNSTNTGVGTVAPSGTQTYFQTVGVGTCVVEAYHSSGAWDTTGTLTVITYNVDYIVIRDSPNGGGSPIGDMTYMVGATDGFYAAGYNNTIGYLGNVIVNWTSDNPSVGNVTTPTGTSTTFSALGPGTCIVTADYGGGISDTTGTLSVASIDYILIRDAPNGGGWEVENMFFYTWQSNVSFYAAAYNNTFGYLGATSVTWTSSDIGVGTVTTPGTATIFEPVGNGTCIVTATYNATISDNTGILTVSSSTVDFILIRDAPGGLGNEVVNYEYQRGEEDIYYGAMYNNIVGYLADVPSKSNWSSSNPSIVSVTNPGNSTTITCSNTNSGNVTITLWAFGLFETDYANVTVLTWTVDYISIRDAPGSSGNVIGDKTYCVWETDTFYVVAFNYTNGYVKDVVASWVSSDINVGTVTSPGSSTTFSALWVATDDTCYVTATFDIYSNSTGFLTVLAPRVDYIQIRSAEGGGGGEISTISYHKGDSDIFYGASYNSTVDYMGSVPVTSTWTSSNFSIVTATSPGNYSDIECSDTNGGTVTITLYDGLGHEYIATVTVLNWTVDYILIRDSPLGGGLDLTDPANYPSYPVGYQTTFYGAMYNDTAGYIGDVASISIWTSNSTVIVEVTSPGSDSTITCSDTEYGIVKITLEDSMANTATTEVTVLEPTIDYIQIRDATGGMGNEIGDVSYEIGETDTFYASAYNNTAMYLRDVSVDWSSDDEDVGTVTTPGSSTTFTAEGIGTCTVTASYNGGMFTDTTGTITVTLPSNITVDDSGGKHFTSIQEAINNAQDGDTIFVYAGTYHEHLTISKSITLMGEEKDDTIIDGDDYGKVIFVTGDNVSISGFTIQDGEYAIYLEETDSTSITYNIIQGYDYGIYCNYTTDAYIAHNTITEGDYGIVTFHANNDAIRWNTISYNTEYGAKDYNSSLKHCFNWNYFYKNKIAYWYDPSWNSMATS
jgi:hypothetical protein